MPGAEDDLGPTYAGRVTAAVFRPFVGEKAALRSLRVGAAYTTGNLPEGLNSLRGETPYGYDYFEPVYVKGRRQRLGFELDWTPGPFGLRSEWIQTREDRLGQGLGNRDLSDFLGTGWYVYGTWIVTGQEKDDEISMGRALRRGARGAIELAVRYEELWFGSVSRDGPPQRNPRADHLRAAAELAVTAGSTINVNGAAGQRRRLRRGGTGVAVRGPLGVRRGGPRGRPGLGMTELFDPNTGQSLGTVGDLHRWTYGVSWRGEVRLTESRKWRVLWGADFGYARQEADVRGEVQDAVSDVMVATGPALLWKMNGGQTLGLAGAWKHAFVSREANPDRTTEWASLALTWRWQPSRPVPLLCSLWL